jgi:hypothetical protein
MNTPGPFEMSEDDVEALRRAKDTLENPGLAARIANLAGSPIEGAMRRLPQKWSAVIHKVTEKSLMAALETALTTVDGQRKLPGKNKLHRGLAAVTGAVGGVFGLPALAIELPVSTMVILRSIADIARSEGENLRSVDAKLACIEVFALGGRTGTDDATESAYFTVRAALATAVADASKYFAARGGVNSGAPAVARLIAQIANRFGVNVTQKMAAQAVPLVGAVGGATLNVLFMSHFQDMAGGHFTVRKLERQYGAEVVRRTYERL